MWSFNSNPISSRSRSRSNSTILQQTESLNQHSFECSDDDVSSNISRDGEGLECPICYESFNIVENIPYVLWCGHTLCKNCVLGLQRAVVKCPTLPVQLPLFISCPWCHLLSFRLVYKGNLQFPRKNFFLLWMVESMNGDRTRSHSFCSSSNPQPPPTWSSSPNDTRPRNTTTTRSPHSQDLEVNLLIANYLNLDRVHVSLRRLLIFFAHLSAKFPLVVLFLLIVLYAIPASVAILLLYILVTIIFALPSVLMLYFAYPTLNWLVREIIAR